MTVNIFVLPLSTNLSLLPSYYDIEKKNSRKKAYGVNSLIPSLLTRKMNISRMGKETAGEKDSNR